MEDGDDAAYDPEFWTAIDINDSDYGCESDGDLEIPIQDWDYTKKIEFAEDSTPRPCSSSAKPTVPKKQKVVLPKRTFKFKKVNFEAMRLPFHVSEEALVFDEPIQYFSQLFTDELFQHVAEMTNLYAIQKDAFELNTEKNEVRRLFGMFLLMGIVKMPATELYWSHECRYGPVADVMSRQRFRSLKKYLHFADNEQLKDSGDKLFKIRPLLDHIRKNLQKNKSEQKNSIDEQMIPFKGRSHLKQYVKNKPHKWGFKAFTLSDANGMMRDFRFYVGADTCKDFGLGVSGNVVLDLCEGLQSNKNYQIFCANWFSSINLAIALRERGFFMVGTIRPDRIGKCPLKTEKELAKEGRLIFIFLPRLKPFACLAFILLSILLFLLSYILKFWNFKVDCNRESGIGSDSDTMAELATLLTADIPEGRSNLADSHTNLERVAEYCEGNYFQSDNKRAALEETKNYTTQSLASVAYQINTLAYNFLQLLDLQTAQLAEMESQMNHIAQTVMIHKEKVARREIGVLTATKTTSRQYKIIAPANPEKPIKYVRKPIDFNALDEVGHGVRTQALLNAVRNKQRGSSQGSIPPMALQGVVQNMGQISQGIGLGPAPTTKPPTPPQAVRPTSTLSKNSGREYRTPPAVAPPQVPSHYAPNYPMGHPRRDRGPGYSTLPAHALGLSGSHTLPHPHHAPPQAMVHPLNHEHHSHMPAPPSPLTLDQPVQHSHHTLPNHRSSRGGNISPPLPPPPPADDEHANFGQPPGRAMGIVPEDHHLPGWVPKNYIEKVVAIYDYYADKEDELSFQESAVIYVLKKNDDEWWEGVMDGITGLFPGNYVEPCV